MTCPTGQTGHTTPAMSDDRPLETQTAAPPVIPPRRPIVGLAMRDDDAPWLQDMTRRLAVAQDVTRAVLALLQERLDATDP